MRCRALVVIAASIVFACEKHEPTNAASTPSATSSASPTATTTTTTTTLPAPSVDTFAQPSSSATDADPLAPYAQKKMVKVSHVGPIEIETRTDKKEYIRVAYHLEVLAKGPPKAAVFGRARCRVGDEILVDDDERFDELDRLAPGESMALYADFFSYPSLDHAPHKCTIVFSYHPGGRYSREPQSAVAAFCVDTEKVLDGECKE